MPPKETKFNVDDLIHALSDKRLIDALVASLTPVLDAVVSARLASLEHSIIAHKQDIDALKNENGNLRVRLSAVEHRVDELENQSLQDVLIFKGLADSSYAERATPTSDGTGTSEPVSFVSVEDTVRTFCREHLKVQVLPSDILSAYRMKRDGRGSDNSTTARPIVVRFANKKTRDSVYRSKRELKNCPIKGIFVSEQLTKYNADVFFDARRCVKQKKLWKTWTQGGHIYVKESDDAMSKPRQIRNASDLPY
jgi:hypothetical protein